MLPNDALRALGVLSPDLRTGRFQPIAIGHLPTSIRVKNATAKLIGHVISGAPGAPNPVPPGGPFTGGNAAESGICEVYSAGLGRGLIVVIGRDRYCWHPPTWIRC
jgi:hypothetical protein